MNCTRRCFVSAVIGAGIFTSGCDRSSKTRNSRRNNSDPIELSQVEFHVPLFDALWNLDIPIRERFGEGKYRSGIDMLGVDFSRREDLKNGEYSHCTPINSLAFAWTGGDGVHFSFLVQNGRIDADSPVIMTSPANSLDENLIAAGNFEKFLEFGLPRSLFGLEQLAYNLTETLHVYGKKDWKPTTKEHYDVGYVPEEGEQDVINFVVESLQLKPFSYSEAEFQALQTQ
jgi:hypothetical protein